MLVEVSCNEVNRNIKFFQQQATNEASAHVCWRGILSKSFIYQIIQVSNSVFRDQLNPIECYGMLIAYVTETLPMTSEAVSNPDAENWQKEKQASQENETGIVKPLLKSKHILEGK